MDQATQAHFKRRILLLVDQRFLAAVEIDFDQQQTRFDARDIQRQHARGLNIESPAGSHQFIPNSQCLVAGNPNFITEVARVTRARNLDRHSGDRAFGDAKIFQVRNVRIADQSLQQPARGRPLQCQRGDTVSEMSSISHVEAGGVLSEPAQAGIGGSPAINIFFQPRHRAIVDHFALLVAPRRVNNLAHRNLAHVARDDAVDQTGRISSGDSVFEERRDIDQRRGVANRVVLVLVMRLVRADRVVAGPLAIVQTLAKWKCSFVKCGSDWHALGVQIMLTKKLIQIHCQA